MDEYIARGLARKTIMLAAMEREDYLTNPCVSALENVPAADVVEVQHAHWIVDDREATCSGCESKTYNWAAWCFDYCPFCGAKMDGRGKE